MDGAVRGFVKDGPNEITTWINLGNNIVGLTSFEKSYSIQASQYIQALITTRVVVLPYKLIMSLFENYPEMLIVSRNLLWKHYQELDERNYMVRLPTAEKRLTRLMETHPEILMVVQHKHIANYLCMRFETLSRLRAKLIKKTY
ncbi:cAMP-binding domain of CRP or a regulatory subunit of cAMP-dependent protein kinases [Pedobacter suwonensis]|uniref:cAMP-binding domain of CRP or a regulatory subunit of cAMP-dependent protein kinases n=1 Tax=Pedobacter suwonensis TaxID=332999 RepID=A0A1I0U3J8_9SPHI|nr:Crp/Fnr family transcriptional regulator [Pedobacter suwonensis]SFA58520.1 cAMP-binding domain of CRP or a regulatory subunit of cAMP-dependent protein kinases [Pedobacter suwonensis]